VSGQAALPRGLVISPLIIVATSCSDTGRTRPRRPPAPAAVFRRKHRRWRWGQIVDWRGGTDRAIAAVADLAIAHQPLQQIIREDEPARVLFDDRELAVLTAS
jgi:hypothetical protein